MTVIHEIDLDKLDRSDDNYVTRSFGKRARARDHDRVSAKFRYINRMYQNDIVRRIDDQFFLLYLLRMKNLR